MSVSILILSNLHQRFDWLLHRLRFLDQAGHKGEVLIGVWGGHDRIVELDAAVAALSGQMRVVVAAHHNSKVEDMSTRALDLAERSQGEYLVMQGDDDFLVPAAFDKPVAILGADPTVSCAQGRVICFDPNADYSRSFKINEFPMWEALESDPLQRFAWLMKRYTFMWHAIYRRAQFIERFTYIREVHANTKDHTFFECVGDLYAVIKGKVVLTDDLFLIKGVHKDNDAKTQREGISYTMPPYLLLSDDFTASYKVFEAQAFKLFRSMNVDVTDNAVRKDILDGMMNFMGHRFFKRRAPQDDREIAFQRSLSQSPTPAPITRALSLVAATGFPPERMTAWPVWRDVGNVRNQESALTEPVKE